MAKKSLSDILREEMKPEAAASQPSTSAEVPTPEPVVSDELKDLTIAIATANEKIALLTAELATERKENKALNNQLTKANQFKTQLEEQKNLVKQLTADLKQASSSYQKALEKEQEKVKEMTEKVNSLDSLEKELVEQKALVSKLYADLQKAQQKPESTASTAPLTAQPKSTKLVSAHRISRYIAPAQPSATLSDEVIGWFD
ncbi:MAG: hypothetical protein VKJ02_19510 [Snowella sp.]|nr:hypothetical protein [Snowella sp.]